MRQFKVAKRYANALFTIAVEKQQVEEVKKDMDLIRGTKNAEMKRVFQSPVITADKKINIFKAVFEKNLSPVTLAFFNLIFSKGRAIAIDDIHWAFEEQYREFKGIQMVHLTTADPVAPALKEEIRLKVQNLQRFKNKTVLLTDSVDPSLVGGFVLKLGDQLFDASVRSDLSAIKKQFVENMYIHNIR